LSLATSITNSNIYAVSSNFNSKHTVDVKPKENRTQTTAAHQCLFVRFAGERCNRRLLKISGNSININKV